MNFLSPAQVVEKPCKEALFYPLQCFQEMFFATPGVVGTFFVGIGGFAIAVVIWAAIFALALFSIFYVLKHLYTASKYLFTQTKVGRKIATLVPLQKLTQKFCCKAQGVKSEKRLQDRVIGHGATLASKVHFDTNWFKSALKHVPFGKSSDFDSSSTRSPSKTPQRSTSRISALTPKILNRINSNSPKPLKSNEDHH